MYNIHSPCYNCNNNYMNPHNTITYTNLESDFHKTCNNKKRCQPYLKWIRDKSDIKLPFDEFSTTRLIGEILYVNCKQKPLTTERDKCGQLTCTRSDCRKTTNQCAWSKHTGNKIPDMSFDD